MRSCIAVDDDSIDVCSNCGIDSSGSGGGTFKLKNCNACRLVKYCGVDCQKPEGPPQAAQEGLQATRGRNNKDEQLYSQGHERPKEDICPICTLPIPFIQ